MTGRLRRVHLLLVAITVGALAMAVAAACGNRSNPIQIVQQDGGAPSGGTGGNTAFLDCLRAHGVPVPSGRRSGFPRPSGSRPSGFPRPSFSRPSGFPRPSFSRRPGGRFPTAIPSACESLRPSGGFGLGGPGGGPGGGTNG